MEIDKARGDEQTACVEDFAVFRKRFAGPQPRGDAAVFDQKTHPRVFGGCRVDQMSVCDQEFHRVGTIVLQANRNRGIRIIGQQGAGN